MSFQRLNPLYQLSLVCDKPLWEDLCKYTGIWSQFEIKEFKVHAVQGYNCGGSLT